MTAGPSAVVLLIFALTALPVGSLKFFHVSDVHLDPFYNKAADVSTYCQDLAQQQIMRHLMVGSVVTHR